MKKLLSMVDIPGEAPPASAQTGREDTAMAEGSREDTAESADGREETAVFEDSGGEEMGAVEDSCGKPEAPEGGPECAGASAVAGETPGRVDIGAGDTGPCGGPRASESKNSSPSVTEVLGTLEMDLERLEEAHNQLVKEHGVTDMDDTAEEEEVYRCQLCALDFHSIDKMYGHQKELGHLELKQTPRGPGYLCWKKGCNQYFKTIEVLQTHFREIHVRKPTLTEKSKCQHCLLEFTDKASLEFHSLYHKVKSVVQCSVCQKGFPTVQLLKSHLQHEHADLGEKELEGLLKNVDDVLMSMVRIPSYEQFFTDYLGCKLCGLWDSTDATHTSADEEMTCVGEQTSPVPKASEQKQTIAPNACINQKSKAPVSKINKAQTTLLGKGNAEVCVNSSLDQANVLQGKQKKKLAPSKEQDQQKSLSDFQSLEDSLNKESVALEKYKDPTRKFKCHECKMGFTKKHYLVVHNRLTKHIPDSVLAYYARERYEDPNRPYKCELCKTSFMQKNGLLVHFNSVCHLRKANEAAIIGAEPVVSDAPTTHTTDSLSQNNSVEPESSVSVPANNNNTTSKIVTHSACSTETFQPVLTSDLERVPCSVQRVPNPHEDKTPHHCDICDVSFGQKSNLETHFRSVAHQKRVVQLYEQNVNGQVSMDQQLCHPPQGAISAAQMQQMQAMLEMMQQQQLSALSGQPVMMEVQTIPALKSVPVSEQRSGTFSASSTSSTSTSHFTSAPRLTIATATAMDTEPASYASTQQQTEDRTSEKKSKDLKEFFADSKNKLTEMAVPNCVSVKMKTTGDVGFASVDQERKSEHCVDSKPKIQEMTAASPNCAYVKRETIDDVDSVSTGISTDTTTYQVLKSEMSTNTTDSSLPSVTKSSDFPSNPVLAASIPLTITQPRGFMGRFKPHLQRNLLENFGFECVMQYNENTQSKRKERWKDKETKKSDCQAENTNNLNTTSESSASCENVDKEDTSVKVETDLPEINKSRCLECGHQFSSIFVLKTHEEEVHKKIIPTDIVEDLGGKFRIILEKRQPKTETLTFVPAQPASVTAVSVTLPLTVTTSLSATTCSSTITTLASDKSSTKSSKEDMPPPPAPLRQLPPPYDMSQAMSMLGMVSMPMNLMSLGMQSSLTPILPSGSVDHTSTFPVNLGMIDAGLSSHQTLQQSSTLTQNQKRARTRINDDQLSILRAHFDINNSPTETQISQMAEMCGLPQKVIKHWFRNTLFKERQKNKDSPYNFNNPPSTTIDLEEYEKTGKLQATVVKMEVCEEDSYIPNSREENTDESYLKAETLLPPHPLEEFMPKQDPEDRRENESQPDAFTPACFASARTTHTPSAPSNSGSLPCSATSILDAQAIVLAREAAAAAQNAATKRANRTRFTDYQVKILHEYFEQNAYPKDDELEHLSKILSLNPRVIVVWFQNARQKARKVFENQPPLESKDSSNGIPFQRTSSLSNHCKKCGAVFQRYFELIKHQKQSCFSENNNNKPFLAYADDDSFSSCTSLEDSGLSDSLNLSANNSQKDRTSPSAVSKPFSCDKCEMSFTQAEHLHNHQKVHSPNTNVDQSLSATSAFGMLQTLAKQEDQTAGETAPPMTSSPTTSTATSACSTPQSLTTLDSNKHKLEPVDHEMGDDQPKDKRLRTTILPEQLDYLYQKYQQDCNPSRKQLELISEEVGLKKRVVQVWFQNTRARERKGQPRTHQQLINKRCPFCNAIFRARSALESHLVNKHPTEMAKGEINIDAIPDVTVVESPQPAHSVPGVSTSHQSASAATDISKMFAQSGIPSYFSFMPASSLALGFPPGLSPSDSVQLSMQHLYEDAYKKYITELSGTTLSPVPLIKTSHVPETLISTSIGQNQPIEKQNTAPSTSVAVDSDAPLDLSMPVRNTKEPSKSNSLDRPITHDRSKLPASLHLLNDRHRSRSPQERTLPERTATQPSQSVRKQPSSSSSTNKSASHSSTDHSPNLSSKSSIPLKSQSGSHTPSSSFNEKAYLEFEHSRSFSQDNSFSETQSELSDGQSRGDVGSSPSGAGSGQKRHRTQMTSLQVKVMKLLFVDYKTPTMAECELLGHQIGLAKRVVQVWFQNARAKEKKFKQTMSKPPTDEFDYPKTAEECLLCHFKYSHKFTVQDHIFTQQHIDNIKEYVLSHADLERDMTDHTLMSGSHRQPSQETEGKAWEKMRSSLSPQQMTQLQQGLNAAALGISTTLPGVASPFSLGSLSSMPEGSASKEFQHKDSRPKKEKKNGNPAPSSGSKTGSSANSQRDKHHHQKQSQQQPQQQQHGQPVGQQATADLAQMMAFGGFLPGLDPSYLGYMYPGLPAFFPGLSPMPLLQPSFLPGAEYMFAHDQLSFGTPLPLLQIPPQAIKAISDKVQDSKCVRAHYTQDCKTLADLKGSVGSQDAACFVESFVDVGYICKKCQMVYPAHEGCLAHQQMICYPGGEAGTKTMVKLEQLQYTCRKCAGEKFSTVSEVQSHCRKESHKAKVSKVNSSASSSASTSAPVQGSPRPAITTSAGCISHALSLPSQVMSKLPVSPHVPVQTSPKPSSSGSLHSQSSPVPSAQVVSGVLPTADDSVSAPSRSEEPSKSSDPPQASQEPASPSLVQSAASQISAKPDNASSPDCTSSASCLTPSVPVLGSNKELTTVPSPSPVDGSPGKSAESAVSPEADSCLDSKHPA